MVKVKVTLVGGETRRLEVSDNITYEELREKITSVFPNIDSTSKLKITYRDSDGDLVTVSSDEEVSTAIGLLPSEDTWKIFVCLPSPVIQPPFLHPFSLLESLVSSFQEGLNEALKEEKEGKKEDTTTTSSEDHSKEEKASTDLEQEEVKDKETEGQDSQDGENKPTAKPAATSKPSCGVHVVHLSSSPYWDPFSISRPFVRTSFARPNIVWF